MTARLPWCRWRTGRPTASSPNNFLSDGGDNFTTFKAGTNKLVGGLDIDSLRSYLLANDPVSVTPTDRVSQQP